MRERHRQKETGRKFDSRLKRIKEEQAVHDVKFEMEATSSSKKFEETISALFGPPGVGKSKFAEQLGLALQKKYSLPGSGVYVLQCERINHPWQIRKSMLTTWPTFRRFVDDVEKYPSFVSTVKMWVVDTLDAIIPKGISTICSDLGVGDLREATRSTGNNNWLAEGWRELRAELLYQILRLAELGPGVLILSHERYRKATQDHIEIERASMDVSNSIYNSVGDACSMIMHMRSQGGGTKRRRAKSGRCIAVLSSDEEEAKDNLSVVVPHYPEGIIPFQTEAEVVGKILDCFGGAIKKRKKVKKKKVKRR